MKSLTFSRKLSHEGGNRLRPLAVLLAPAALIGSLLLPGCATPKAEQVPQKTAGYTEMKAAPTQKMEVAKPLLAQNLKESQFVGVSPVSQECSRESSELKLIKGQIFGIAGRPFVVSEVGPLGITLADTTRVYEAISAISQDTLVLDPAFLQLSFGNVKLFEGFGTSSFCLRAEPGAKGGEVKLTIFSSP